MGDACDDIESVVSGLPVAVDSASCPFPTHFEATMIADSLKGMAAVYFCQLISNAYGDAIVASNDKSFFDLHFDAIATIAFSDVDARNEFDELCTQLRDARNKMIGHADASAFGMTQRDGLTSHALHATALSTVCDNNWTLALIALRRALDRHLLDYETGSTE